MPKKLKLLKALKEIDGEEFPEAGFLLDLWKEIQNLMQEVEKVRGIIPERVDLSPIVRAHADFTNALNELRRDVLLPDTITSLPNKLKDINLEMTLSRTKLQGLEEFRAKMVETLDEVGKKMEGRAKGEVTLKDLEEVRIKLLSIIASNTGGGNANRDEKVDGANVLRPFTDINWISGTGVSITTSANQTTKYTDITIAATGGTLNTEVPSGTVDGVNVTFTFTHVPTVIVVDQGRTMMNGSGWSLAGFIATMDVAPVMEIFSIY